MPRFSRRSPSYLPGAPAVWLDAAGSEVTPPPPLSHASSSSKQVHFFCVVTIFSSQTVTAVISPVAPVKTNMA